MCLIDPIAALLVKAFRNSHCEFWLRRLSHDPAPEVRVAAIRAASEQTLVDLSDRLDQMARSDPSPTVSQLARYFSRSPTEVDQHSFPDSAGKAFNLGLAHFVQGDFATARLQLKSARDQLPEESGWKALADLYLSLASSED